MRFPFNLDSDGPIHHSTSERVLLKVPKVVGDPSLKHGGSLQCTSISIPIILLSFEERSRILYIANFKLGFKKIEHRVLFLYVQRKD